MTAIDKAIKALEPFAPTQQVLDLTSELDGDVTGYVDMAGWQIGPVTMANLRDAAQALSDLSSLKVGEGDVEWLAEMLRETQIVHGWSPVGRAHNARIDRLLSLLGHGGVG